MIISLNEYLAASEQPAFTVTYAYTLTYVTNDDLKEMMTGAHIVMGYASQAYLCPSVAEMFAREVIWGFLYYKFLFAAGDQAESQYADDNHIQKVLYMTGTRYEKITSPPNDYGTHQTNTVAILTNGIHMIQLSGINERRFL